MGPYSGPLIVGNSHISEAAPVPRQQSSHRFRMVSYIKLNIITNYHVEASLKYLIMWLYREDVATTMVTQGPYSTQLSPTVELCS